jgi:hypothetical protein
VLHSLILLVVAAGMAGLPAQTAAPSGAPTVPKESSSALHEISPGVFDFHGIRLDKKNRRISFPAVVNQRQGLIEYLLVNDKGKTHESLLSTALRPRDIHVALLLIGLDPDALPAPKDQPPPSAIDSAYLQAAPKLKGVSVTISATWTADGKSNGVALEDWIFNLQTNKPMTPGPWTYNGSMIEDGAFLADQDLSIVAVITDPTALANNPRAGYDNDQIWQVREEKVPPLDTPVEVSITLPETSGKITP